MNGGNGASGAAGTSGIDASQSSAPVGSAVGNANEANLGCNDSSHGAGGSGGTQTCGSGYLVRGGNAGNGGEMDTFCDLFNPNNTATNASVPKIDG